jgi:hypothetical protein
MRREYHSTLPSIAAPRENVDRPTRLDWAQIALKAWPTIRKEIHYPSPKMCIIFTLVHLVHRVLSGVRSRDASTCQWQGMKPLPTTLLLELRENIV